MNRKAMRQATAEAFYRRQATPVLAVTGDVQFVSNPALDPATSSFAVFGIRGRLAL
jgi:hypothetical protein